MTSFVFEPRRKASAWIAALSSSGMRRSTTGLEPGSGLRRFVGVVVDAEGVGEDADGDVVEAGSAAGGLADESLLQGGRRPNEDALPWRSASSQSASSIASERAEQSRTLERPDETLPQHVPSGSRARCGCLAASSRSWRRTNRIRWITVIHAIAARR